MVKYKAGFADAFYYLSQEKLLSNLTSRYCRTYSRLRPLHILVTCQLECLRKHSQEDRDSPTRRPAYGVDLVQAKLQFFILMLLHHVRLASDRHYNDGCPWVHLDRLSTRAAITDQ